MGTRGWFWIRLGKGRGGNSDETMVRVHHPCLFLSWPHRIGEEEEEEKVCLRDDNKTTENPALF